MALIKVIRGGCGIRYTDANGTARHALKTPEDGAFECDDAQAARLINLGVAAVHVEGIGWQQVGQEVASSAQQTDGDDKVTGHLDAEQLEEMDYNALKALAADMGVKPEGQKKADYIAAIVAADVEIGEEDDGDELPELNAADPE